VHRDGNPSDLSRCFLMDRIVLCNNDLPLLVEADRYAMIATCCCPPPPKNDWQHHCDLATCWCVQLQASSNQ
jgi:hypothetical protein